MNGFRRPPMEEVFSELKGDSPSFVSTSLVGAWDQLECDITLVCLTLYPDSVSHSPYNFFFTPSFSFLRTCLSSHISTSSRPSRAAVIRLGSLGQRLSLCFLASDCELDCGLIPFYHSTYNCRPHNGHQLFLQRPGGYSVSAVVFGL